MVRKWDNYETIARAETSFNQAIEADPFEGSAVVEALAGIIRATESLPEKVSQKAGLTKISEFVLAHIGYAREAAEAAPDPVYARILRAQEEGWQSVVNIAGGGSQSNTSSQPTETAGKRMSDAKTSNT